MGGPAHPLQPWALQPSYRKTVEGAGGGTVRSARDP